MEEATRIMAEPEFTTGTGSPQTFFSKSPETPEDVFFSKKEQLKTPTDYTVDSLATTFSAALNRPYDEVRAEIASGMLPTLKGEANNKASLAARGRANSVVEGIIATAGDTETALANLETVRESLFFQDFVSPDIGLMLNENTAYSETEKRVFDRVISAQRIIEDKKAERSPGIAASIGYFADAAVSGAVHNVLGAPFELLGIEEEFTESGRNLVELAQETAQLIVSGVSPEQFEREFTAILDRVANAGGFSEENPFFLEGFLELVSEAGVGSASAGEELFQVLDVATAGGSTLLRTLTGSSGLAKAPKLISKIGNRDAAERIIVEAGKDGAILTENTAPMINSPARLEDDYWSAPELSANRQLEINNSVLKLIKKANFGAFVKPEIIEAKRVEWTNRIKEANKAYKSHELNYGIRVGDTGNIYPYAVMGRRDGSPYKSLPAAQKLATKMGGEVREQLVEGDIRYVVLKEWDQVTTGLADTTDLKSIATSLLSGIMSTTARTTSNLDAMIKRGEAQANKAMKDLKKVYRRQSAGLAKGDRGNIDAILLELRDDPLFNQRTEPYTALEFKGRYLEKFGVEPSDKVTDYWQTLIEINDVDYYLNADILLKDAINDKNVMVQLNGVYYRSKPVKLDPDASVYDMDNNKLLLASDFDPDRAVFYEVMNYAFEAGETGGKIQYVVGKNLTTRRLYHTDVMPYNVGGHRTYTDALDFYIKQVPDDLKLAGGKTVASRPITFMGVRREVEAKQVVREFNNIAAAVRASLPDVEIAQVIARNSNWNTSIEDLDDFKAFANEHNLDISRDVALAPDNELIVGQTFGGEETVGSSFRGGLNASKKRGTRPLVGFGGEDLSTLDPTRAIERGVAQTISRKADMVYLHNAINGWLKAAKESGAIQNPTEIAGLTPKMALQKAGFSVKTAVGKALEQERKTIQYRLSNTTSQIAMESMLMRGMADFVYGKSPKLAKAIDWVSTKDPAGFIRATAFHSKLGLFAFDQLYVQASQVISVVGIASGTLGATGAIRSQLAVVPLRMALIEQIPKEALERIARIQAPFSGISPEDFIQLRDWVKSTGRNIIEKTMVEENNAAGSIVSNRLLDYGQTFFREGELIARLGAASANLLERRKLFPGEDIFSDAVTNQMIHRQDVLTASMTSASSAPWQKSLLAIPLQFTTFHVRLTEQLFTREILTRSERVRLGLTHLLAFGTAAAPVAGYLQDRMGYDGALDPSTGVYDVVRYGALDAILSGLTGEETALSSRLAVGEGLFDLFVGLAEKPLPEVMAGPGGSILYDTSTALYKLLGTVFSGRDHLTGYDINRVARNITSYNRGYSFWLAQRYGMAISRKTDDVVLDELDKVDSFMIALGIPLREQDTLWTAIKFGQEDKKYFDKHLKEILRLDNIAARLIADGEFERAGVIMEDIGASLDLLPPGDRIKAMSRLRDKLTLPASIIRSLERRGKDEYANRLKEQRE